MPKIVWSQWRPALVLACLALCATWTAATEKVEARHKSTEDRLKKDLFYLASDELEGRGPGTQGQARAADHIAAEFKKVGLKPAGQAGSYFQYFIVPGATLSQPASLSFKGPKAAGAALVAGRDFNPLGVSKSGASKDVGVVFAGHGVSKKDYDDYKGLDAAGKVVVVLRDAPKFFSAPDLAKYSSVTEKVNAAEKADALALVLVNTSDIAADGDDLLNFSYWATARFTAKLPVFQIKRAAVNKLLTAPDTTLEKLEKAINDNKAPQSKVLEGWTSSFDVKVKRDGLELRNVIGVLEGKGPRANETILIGAHYDHLGYGGFGSLGRGKKMVIHNGADDNGSGTVSVLELARRFGAMKDREGRRMVFMTFAGEEMGLLGSAHYCKAPIFPLDQTAAMINLDMVGRMPKDLATGQETLQVLGTGSAKTFDKLIDELNKNHNITLKKNPGSRGDSDHHHFNLNKVPYYFFFSGMHPDYHRSTDDPDKINYTGMRRIIDLVEDAAKYLSTVPERPVYVKVAGSSGPRPGVPGIRLGIAPDYSDAADGVKVESVTENGLAAKAGIKGGDRIVKMGDQAIKKLEEYMVFMGKQKKGDTIEVTVVREKKELKLKVKLE